MTDEVLIHLVRAHFEGLFPKECTTCRRRYESLRDYIIQTEKLGQPISHDIALGDWQPADPLGTLVVANCACGTTLALSTRGMPLPLLHAGHDWIKRETRRRHLTHVQLLAWLRDEIRRQVLDDPTGRS